MGSLQHPCHPTGQRPSPWIPVSLTPPPRCKDPALRPSLAQPSRVGPGLDQSRGARRWGPGPQGDVLQPAWGGRGEGWAGSHGSLPCEEPRAADSEVSRDLLTAGSLQAQPAPLGVRARLQNWVPRDFSSSAAFGGGAGGSQAAAAPGGDLCGTPLLEGGPGWESSAEQGTSTGPRGAQELLLPRPAWLMFGG